MKERYLVLWLLLGLPLAVTLNLQCLSQAMAATIQIAYEYNSVGVCSGARATLDGNVIGEARLERLVKGEYYLVRETHYAPRTGAVVYEGLAKFAIGIGAKIEERPSRGQKVIDIFRDWPSAGGSPGMGVSPGFR